MTSLYIEGLFTEKLLDAVEAELCTQKEGGWGIFLKKEPIFSLSLFLSFSPSVSLSLYLLHRRPPSNAFYLPPRISR